jgi:hypothetical protein
LPSRSWKENTAARTRILVAAGLEAVVHRIDADDEVLDVGVADDDPAVAEFVLVGVDVEPRLLTRAAQDLLHVRDDGLEVAGGQRLEHDPGRAARRDLLRRVEVDIGRAHREQPVLGRRAGDLALAEQGVEEAHAGG